MYMGDKILLGLLVSLVPLSCRLTHMGADTRKVFQVVSLLKTSSRVHHVALIKRILGGVRVVLHVLGESYKDRPLHVKMLVRREVIRPRGYRASDAESGVVFLFRHVSDEVLQPSRIVDIGIVGAQVDKPPGVSNFDCSICRLSKFSLIVVLNIGD